MATMRFMSCPRNSGLPKSISFDSSPGRAIAQALGSLDEKSYRSVLREEREGSSIFEIFMRPLARASGEQGPEQKVGMLTYTPSRF